MATVTRQGWLTRAVLLLAMLGATGGVAGCDRLTGLFTVAPKADVKFPYRTRLSLGADARDMTITAEGKGAGLSEVREAARFEATRHCLARFGRSDAEWTVDPATGDWAFTADANGTLTMTARCTGGV